MQVPPRPASSKRPSPSRTWLKYDSALERLLGSAARGLYRNISVALLLLPFLQAPSYRNSTVHVIKINILLLHGEKYFKQLSFQKKKNKTGLHLLYDEMQDSANVDEMR